MLPERERDVVPDRHGIEQGGALEDHPHPLAKDGQLLPAHAGDVLPVDHHPAAIRLEQPHDVLHQDRLAASRRAQDDDGVALGDLEIDALQDQISLQDQAPALHSETQAGLHLIPCEAVHKTEPCNACFFHKVLGNGLIPKETLPATVQQSIEPADPRSVAAIHAPFNPDGNRGPPNS